MYHTLRKHMQISMCKQIKKMSSYILTTRAAFFKNALQIPEHNTLQTQQQKYFRKLHSDET